MSKWWILPVRDVTSESLPGRVNIHVPMAFPGYQPPFSYGFPIETSIFLWFSYGFPMVFP